MGDAKTGRVPLDGGFEVGAMLGSICLPDAGLGDRGEAVITQWGELWEVMSPMGSFSITWK